RGGGGDLEGAGPQRLHRDIQRPSCCSRGHLGSARDELFDLALDRLLDDPAPVRVAWKGLGELPGLLELDVRWERRDFRVRDRLIDHDALMREGLIPGRAD